jgi:hypothetical protein
VSRWTREEQIAWAAGLFDGEGTTSVSGLWDTPHVSVPQSGPVMPEVLVLFHSIVGVGSICRLKDEPGRQPHWVAHASGPKALRVLELLWPHLGPIKRQQANAALVKYRRHSTPSRRIAALTGRPYVRRSGRGRNGDAG